MDVKEYQLEELLYEELSAKEDEMQAEVARQMAADHSNPRSQMYFMRLDCNRIVRSDEEYERLSKEKIPMKIVSYNVAANCEQNAESLARDLVRSKTVRKSARKARRVNRG